jgi:chaperonin GroEL
VAFLRVLSALGAVVVEGDERVGLDILRRALEEPTRMIAANAGKDGSVVVDKVKSGQAGFGYNAETDTYEDMLTAGIIDPAKVTRSALQNAVSIAVMVLTTEAGVTDLPKKEEPAHNHGGAGMGMY